MARIALDDCVLRRFIGQYDTFDAAKPTFQEATQPPNPRLFASCRSIRFKDRHDRELPTTIYSFIVEPDLCHMMNKQMRAVAQQKAQVAENVTRSNVGGFHSTTDLFEWPHPCCRVMLKMAEAAVTFAEAEIAHAIVEEEEQVQEESNFAVAQKPPTAEQKQKQKRLLQAAKDLLKQERVGHAAESLHLHRIVSIEGESYNARTITAEEEQSPIRPSCMI